jgi:hypothetical protein
MSIRKVNPGDPLRIPADAYNAFVDAANAHRNGERTFGAESRRGFQQASIVLVRNDSGADLSRFAVLGVEEPVISPNYNENEFKNRVALAGVEPAADTHEGRFVIFAEPLADGALGLAFAAGVCPVQVDVDDDDEQNRLADVADGETGHLKAGLYGSAGILWREGGTGTQWAVVRLGIAPGIRPYALDPCDDPEYYPTRYTIDNLVDYVGQVVKVSGDGGDACYTVRIPEDDELECVDPECGLSITGPFESCCECAGEVKLTLTNCDDPQSTSTMQVSGATVAVGDVVRINDHCYTVDATEDCDDQETATVLDPYLVFASCEECQGACFTLTHCETGSTMDVRSPNIEAGDIVEVDGECYEVADRECTGSETDISATASSVYDSCEDCREDTTCTGSCADMSTATATASGNSAAEACQAAEEAALSNAESACGGRGINVCMCDSGPAVDNGDGTWSCWAVVCYECCCPDGYTQVELVTDVRCENDEIVIDKEKFCIYADDCQEGC